jgi:hypothetical protein
VNDKVSSSKGLRSLLGNWDKADRNECDVGDNGNREPFSVYMWEGFIILHLR